MSDASPLTGQPTWFGPPQRPLFGVLHLPADGRARGGLVMCPPVGIERSHGHYVMRCAALALQRAGFAVLRFDYDGTGQSAGELNDPGRTQAWLDSIRAAIAFVRSTGVEWTGGIGLRLGATLLANVAVEQALDATLLWDPCHSGKVFIREQTALQFSVSPAADRDADHPEIPGYRLTRETVDELSRLELPTASALAGHRVLVLADPQRAQNARVARRLPADQVEWQEYLGPAEVFDVGAWDFTAPQAVLSQITGWVTARCDVQPVAATRPPTHPEVTFASEPVPVRESLISLGPHRLFAIVTEPATGPMAPGPTVLMVSMAAECSIGPARQWVELSRRWAGAGVRCVRVDLSGVGESPARPGIAPRRVYGLHLVQDIADAAAAVSPTDPSDVMVMGVCSGAYQSLAAAPRFNPRGVVAANPLLTIEPFAPHAVSPADPDALLAEMVDPERGSDSTGLIKRLASRGRGTTWRRDLGERTPRWVWTVIYRLGLARSPAVMLEPLIRARVNTLLLCGPHEAHVPLTRTPRVLERLTASGVSRVEVVDGFDHSLRDHLSRATFAAQSASFLAAISPGAPGTTEPAATATATATATADDDPSCAAGAVVSNV